MGEAPAVTPSVANASGAATLGSSFTVFTTTASGWDAVTVTLYCLPSGRPGAPRFGSFALTSIGFAPPGAIVRANWIGPQLPSKGADVAVAVTVLGPRVWMSNGVL